MMIKSEEKLVAALSKIVQEFIGQLAPVVSPMEFDEFENKTEERFDEIQGRIENEIVDEMISSINSRLDDLDESTIVVDMLTEQLNELENELRQVKGRLAALEAPSFFGKMWKKLSYRAGTPDPRRV